MTRRLASNNSSSKSTSPSYPTTLISGAAPKPPASPYRWDDTQHPMYSHPNIKAYGRAAIINGILPPPTPSSTSYTPSTIPGTPAPLTVAPAQNCPLPEAHTLVSVGGILTKIPRRIVKRTETEVATPNASTTTTSLISDSSIKPQSPICWDDNQHPMYSHPNFKTYRQAAMINGIDPSTVHYIPSTIPGTPAPIKPQPEEDHTTISNGGILSEIPTRMAKKVEKVDEVEVPSSNVSVKKEAYPMPIMPITQSLINRGLMDGIKTGSIARRGIAKPTTANIKLMPEGFAAAAAATFTQASNGSDGERSDIKWEREQERQKKGKEEGCWSDREDWVGLQSGLPVEGKNAPKPVRAEDEERAEVRGCYENNEDSLGFQSGSHLRPVSSSIGDKSTPKSNGWALGQDIDADEMLASCAAVAPDLVLASFCEDSSPIPAEGTMERYGRILYSMPGDEKRKAVALIESVEDLIPSTTRRQDGWYLAAVGALIGTQQSELVADLYTYLCAKEEYRTSEQRQALVRRMREALLKLVPIVGMPLITHAFMALVSVEAPEDHDISTSWTNRQFTTERLKTARNSMKTFLKAEELETMYKGFGSHQDLAWVTENVVYGLFLSDTSVLSAADTKLVVFPALLCTGKKLLAEAHMQGALELGMSVEDVEGVRAICELLAGWKSVDGRGLKRAKDVRR